MEKEESQNSDNKTFIVFVIILLVILIIYMLIALHDHKHLKGPMGPPGPVTNIPTIILPIPVDENTKRLTDYTDDVILIVPMTEYPIISDDLPLSSPCVIKITTYSFLYQGTINQKTYLYTLDYVMGEGSYHKIRSVDEENGVMNDSGWILVADPANKFIPS
jgi:hypothetical protein